MQVMPWILDVGYTVMCVALMLAAMGHILFGDFEVTMFTLPESISGRKAPSTPPSCLSDHLLNGTILLPVTQDYVSTQQQQFSALLMMMIIILITTIVIITTITTVMLSSS